MDLLNQIINSLKKEEIRFFKLFASRSHSEGVRKDIELFNYIRQQEFTYDETEIQEQLYPGGNKNAFYRLKNRLLEELNKSLWLQHFEKDSVSICLYLYSLAKLHYDHSRYEVSHHFLKRAERQAISTENFEVLDLIYGLFIKLSYDLHGVNPEEYIKNRQENRKQLEALSAIDDLLAMVTYRLKVSMNYGAKDKRILSLLQETLDEYTGDTKILRSTKLRIKVYEAVSKLLLQRNEFTALESYLRTTFEAFSQEQVFTRQTHETKLSMLTYLVNSLNKNGKFQASLAFAEQLKIAMEEYGGILFDKYQIFYHHALFESYVGLEDPRAIDILLKFKADPQKYGASSNLVFIYCNLSLIYYRNRQYREAQRNLVDLYLLQDYQNVDKGLRLKIEIFELVLRYLRDEHELISQRIRQIRKDYEEELDHPEYITDKDFVVLIEKMSLAEEEIDRRDRIQSALLAFQATHIDKDEETNVILDYGYFVTQQLTG